MKIKVIDETYLKGKNLDDHYKNHVAKDDADYEKYEHTPSKKFRHTGKDDYNRHGHYLTQQPVYSSELSDSHDVIGYFNID